MDVTKTKLYSPEVSVVKTKKRKLEQDILELIRSFNAETHMGISAISVSAKRVNKSAIYIASSVEVVVVL